jgi:hypothetical protein
MGKGEELICLEKLQENVENKNAHSLLAHSANTVIF